MTDFSDQPLKHTVLKFMAQNTQLHLFTLPFTMSPSHHYSRLILTLTNTDNHSLSSVAEARNLSLTIHCLLLSRIMAQNGPSLVSAIITMNTVTYTLVSAIITMNTVTTHTGFCNHHNELSYHTHRCPGPWPLWQSAIITMYTVITNAASPFRSCGNSWEIGWSACGSSPSCR